MVIEIFEMSKADDDYFDHELQELFTIISTVLFQNLNSFFWVDAQDSCNFLYYLEIYWLFGSIGLLPVTELPKG